MQPTRLPALVLLILAIAPVARGAGPAEDLLRLVPPDAGATATVEDLRGHAREFLDSPLAEGLCRLPAFTAERSRGFRRALAEIEKALGVGLVAIRDDLLGDAVVLALRLAPADPPERAQGLLLLRFRDLKLLRRLLEALDTIEKQKGHIVEQTQRTHKRASYTVRTFRPGTNPAQYYAIIGDDIFAWSNSEDMIRGVIDREAGAPGLADEPRFRRVHDRLPGRAVARFYLDPRLLGRLLTADARPKGSAEERVVAMLTRNLAAVEYAGAALEWRDGLILHTRESVDPAKLDALLRPRPERTGAPEPLLARVPETALALAAGRVEFDSAYDALVGLVPEAERTSLDNGLEVVRGLLLGKDPRKEILPRLGPGLVAYAAAPEVEATSEARWPLVLVVGLPDNAEDGGVAAALDNALRTVLALYALDRKHQGGRLRIESRGVGGARLTTLGGGPRPSFAYAVGRGLLVIGTSAEAVEGYCTGRPDARGGPRFERFRAAHFPEAEAFAYVDLPRLAEAAGTHRDRFAAAIAARHGVADAAARRDLDQVLSLMVLFEGAFVAVEVDRDLDATSVHRTVGLIARDPAAPALNR